MGDHYEQEPIVCALGIPESTVNQILEACLQVTETKRNMNILQSQKVGDPINYMVCSLFCLDEGKVKERTHIEDRD